MYKVIQAFKRCWHKLFGAPFCTSPSIGEDKQYHTRVAFTLDYNIHYIDCVFMTNVPTSASLKFSNHQRRHTIPSMGTTLTYLTSKNWNVSKEWCMYNISYSARTSHPIKAPIWRNESYITPWIILIEMLCSQPEKKL